MEVEVHLQGNGKAHVTYRVHWSNTGTDMHGFYLQGTAGKPSFKPSVAVLPSGRKVPLKIKRAGNKWDVILAKGRGWGPGEATYVVQYETDLFAAKRVDLTTKGSESLMVFNWAAV